MFVDWLQEFMDKEIEEQIGRSTGLVTRRVMAYGSTVSVNVTVSLKDAFEFC